MRRTRLSQVQLELLRGKYRRLLELRLAREAAVEAGHASFPMEERGARRAAMKQLADEFPGSLRELDVSSSRELELRLAELDQALLDGPVPDWAPVCLALHEVLRHLLRSPHAKHEPGYRLMTTAWGAVAERTGVSATDAERLVYPARH
jgi:hypothetical protein